MPEDRSSVELFHLRQTLKELKKRKSQNGSTSLVTLYIPPGTQLSDIASLLRDELGTATNIKDRKTGKAVADALQSILARLPNYKNTDNGLIIFGGRTAHRDKVEFFAIYPPEKVTIKTYRCEPFFDTSHLEEMLEHQDQYGVIAIDRGGATFAVIKGSFLQIIHDQDSFVPSKHGRGGQSAGRIERGIEILAQEFFSKMAELANKIYLEQFPVKYIIVGGPAMSKDDFLQHKRLDYRLKEKILKTYDVGYTGVQGIRDILDKAKDDLAEIALIGERNLVEQFKKELGTDTGKVTYGETAVRHALEMGAVETVLFSDGIEKKTYSLECKSCKYTMKKSALNDAIDTFEASLFAVNCPQCGNTGTMFIEDEEELIDEFERLAIGSGARIEVISQNHEAGAELLKAFTGLAAILRYPLNF